MRHRRLLPLALIVLGIAGLAVAQNTGIQAVIGNVFLQDTTPGTEQIGHAAIKGTFRAGQVNVAQATGTTIPVIGNNTSVGAGTAVGGSFSAGQQSSIALRGTATSTTGPNIGVRGETRSAQGTGVLGVAGGKDAFGMWARNTDPNGPALVAENTGGGLAAKFFGQTVFQGFTGVNGFFRVSGAASEIAGGDTLGGLPFRATFGNNQASSLTLRKTGSTANVLLVGSTNFSRIDLVSQNAVQVTMGASSNGTGSITADVKNFIQPDPDDFERDIVYASVEGPEAAAYVRGTARLVKGRATVTLPRHFQNVSVAEGMTVQVTPRSADSDGLAVVSQSLSQFEVRELRRGTGTYEFYWEVKAVRRGFTEYKVYQDWEEPLATESDHNQARKARRDNARRVYGIDYRSDRP